jgi:hypothetical protein
MEAFYTYINDWLETGAYGFVTEATAFAIESMIYGYLELLNWAIPFAWGVAKTILEDFGVNVLLDNAWNSLPSTSASILKFFKIDDAINMILNAAVTKFVLKFIPGL